VLHVDIGLDGLSRLKMKTNRWWSVDSSTLFLTRTSNTQWHKSAETMHATQQKKFLPKKDLFSNRSSIYFSTNFTFSLQKTSLVCNLQKTKVINNRYLDI